MSDYLKGVPEGLYGGRTDKNREAGQWRNFYPNNTFKGLRLASKDYSLYYSIWCTNETEFYDLKVSPASLPPREIANCCSLIKARSPISPLVTLVPRDIVLLAELSSISFLD